jgi:hypothetical protein
VILDYDERSIAFYYDIYHFVLLLLINISFVHYVILSASLIYFMPEQNFLIVLELTGWRVIQS